MYAAETQAICMYPGKGRINEIEPPIGAQIKIKHNYNLYCSLSPLDSLGFTDLSDIES